MPHTTREAAQELGVGPDTVRAYLAELKRGRWGDCPTIEENEFGEYVISDDVLDKLREVRQAKQAARRHGAAKGRKAKQARESSGEARVVDLANGADAQAGGGDPQPPPPKPQGQADRKGTGGNGGRKRDKGAWGDWRDF